MLPMFKNISKPHNIVLPDGAIEIISKMLVTSERITLKKEFNSGFGDSRVFLVEHTKDGQKEMAVIKIAASFRIQKEWYAYNFCMPQRRGITQIIGNPVYSFSGTMAGLQYPFVGNGDFLVDSLFDYCQDASIEQLTQDILEDELAENLKVLWANRRELKELNWLQCYGRLLPEFLYVVETAKENAFEIMSLTKDSIRSGVFEREQYVQITGWRISSIKNDSIILTVADEHRSPYAIRWKPLSNIMEYRLGETINSILLGKIVKTRADLLEDLVHNIAGYNFDLKTASLELAAGLSFPNPLVYITELLDRSFEAFECCVHGDLHLRNILVEHCESDFIGHLIDFDNTCRNHVLIDPLRLETNIMVWVVPKIMHEADLPLKTIREFYFRLHEGVMNNAIELSGELARPTAMLFAIRKLASAQLVVPGDWKEYYQGLIICLVAALRYPVLHKEGAYARLSGEVLFVAAGYILEIMLGLG